MRSRKRDPEELALQGEAASEVVLVFAIVVSALAALWLSFGWAAESVSLVSTSDVHGEDFEDLRGDFEAAADWAVASGQCPDYHLDLPPQHEHLAVSGLVHCWDSIVFIPQWSRIIDDAGGYWRLESGSPEGFDMWGMICRDPVDLGGGWWSCGMP